MRALFAASLLATAACTASGSTATSSPSWVGAERTPADVELYVHIEGAAQLRARLGGQPLGQALRRVIADESVTRRWSGIAQRLGLSETKCFDELLGRDLRFVARRGEDGMEWLLATDMDEATLGRVRDRLHGRMSTGGFIEFPCQGLVAAWRPPTLWVAPGRCSRLLSLAVGAAVPDRGASLAALPLVEAAAKWPSTQVQLFIRHTWPVAGESIFTVEFDAAGATVRHRTRADSLGGRSEVPDVRPIDGSILQRFEGTALAAMVRPQCDDAALPVLSAALPDFRPCEGMRRNAGDRWLLAIGDSEPTSSLQYRAPMLAVALEVREPCKGRRQHLAMLERALASFNARYADALGGAVVLPKGLECADLESPQHCDLNWALRAVSEDHPLLRTCSLHWRTVVGERDLASWQVYASHREWLDRVSLILESAPSESPRSSVPDGFVRGPALAGMIASWREQAAEFAPDDQARFSEGMEMVVAFLRGVEWIRWRSEQPERTIVESTIRLELAPGAAQP